MSGSVETLLNAFYASFAAGLGTCVGLAQTATLSPMGGFALMMVRDTVLG